MGRLKTTLVTSQPRGRRGYSDAHRDEIRQAFIEAGRRLLAGGTEMSMRRIAAEAGWSAAAIYQYFPDQRALLAEIRQGDMNAATDAMEAVATRVTEPRERLREVFLTGARYWLAHPDHFDCLFTSPPEKEVLRCADGTPFGQSDTVRRSLALYRRVVGAFLDALPARPVTVEVAVDVLIAATHGVIAFPRATRSMHWTATLPMVECVIDALLDTWSRTAFGPGACERTRVTPDHLINAFN